MRITIRNSLALLPTSLPLDARVSQGRSSPLSDASSSAGHTQSAVASHFASSSSKVYLGRSKGFTTRPPCSTATSTAAPSERCNTSKILGGTSSITEPPTLYNFVVYIINNHPSHDIFISYPGLLILVSARGHFLIPPCVRPASGRCPQRQSHFAGRPAGSP